MSFQLIIFEVALLSATGLAVVLARAAWTRRPIKGTVVFSGLISSAGLWALSYALELVCTSMLAKLIWAKVQYVGIVAIPYLWIIFALQYTRLEERIKHPRIVVMGLLIEPLITLILVLTNEMHGLVWRDVQWGTIGAYNTAVFLKGAWYWINLCYSYLLVLIGGVLIGLFMLRSTRKHKGQTVIWLVIVLTPWLGNILYIFGLSPVQYLDYTPFGFVIAGIAVILGLYQFNLFNIIPIARDLIIDSISDAVIVIDCQGRVVDLNSTASRIMQRERKNIIGELSHDILPGIPSIGICGSIPSQVQSEQFINSTELRVKAANTDNSSSTDHVQYFDIAINPVFTRRNRHVGHLIILQDVTAHVQMQQNLVQQQQELEKVVSERTAELTQTNAQLEIEVSERRKAEKEIEERAEELRALYDTGRRVTATLSLEHATRAALDVAMSTLSPDMALLYLVQDGTLKLYGFSQNEEQQNVKLPPVKKLGRCLCGRAALTGEPYFALNIHTNPYCILDECKNAGFQSFAALPLKHGSAVLGILGLASYQEHDYEQRAPFLNALTVQIASGVRNAMLHSQIQQQVADMAVEVMERKKAEEALEEHRDQLEQTIHARTVTLNETNTLLQLETLKREQSTSALEQSEALYRRLVETSPDAITLTDLEGRVIMTNLQAARMHGFSSISEAIGINAFATLLPEDRENLKQRLQNILSLGSIQGVEYEILRKDGTTYPIEVSASVITNADGHPTGYMAIYRDITERQLAYQLLQTAHHDLELRVQQRTAELQTLNRALRDSEVKLMEAQQLAQLGNWEWDIRDGKIKWSEEIFRIFDISPTDFTETYEGFLALVHPEDRNLVEVAIQDAIDNHKPINMEHRITSQNGSIRVIHEQAIIIRDSADKPLRITGTAQDITARSMVERALKRQNEELAAINMVAATISRELDLPRALQQTLGIILEVSHLHSAWILMTAENGELALMASQGITENEIWSFTKIFDAEITAILDSREAKSLDVSQLNVFGEGNCYDLVLVLVPIQARDAVLGIFSALCITTQFTESENISLLTAVGNQIGMVVENTRLLDQASQIEILQELDRLRSELIANVSHELRTPLGLITLFASNLLLDEIELPKNKQREFIKGIHEEAENLERIVDDLLNLSRIEGGRLRLNQQPADLQQIAQRAASALRIELNRRRLKRKFVTTPLVANVDQKRIEQVVRNLLSNAIKYSPDGSIITISGFRDAEDVGLCIIDQGIGVPFDEQALIFQRFYRIDNDITRRTRGTGLGLAISKAIVEAHGGRIWMESTPGEGSTFCISFTALLQRALPDKTEDG